MRKFGIIIFIVLLGIGTGFGIAKVRLFLIGKQKEVDRIRVAQDANSQSESVVAVTSPDSSDQKPKKTPRKTFDPFNVRYPFEDAVRGIRMSFPTPYAYDDSSSFRFGPRALVPGSSDSKTMQTYTMRIVPPRSVEDAIEFLGRDPSFTDIAAVDDDTVVTVRYRTVDTCAVPSLEVIGIDHNFVFDRVCTEDIDGAYAYMQKVYSTIEERVEFDLRLPHEKLGISFDLPEGWELGDDDGERVELHTTMAALSDDPDITDEPVVFVFEYTASNDGLSVDEWMIANLDRFPQSTFESSCVAVSDDGADDKSTILVHSCGTSTVEFVVTAIDADPVLYLHQGEQEYLDAAMIRSLIGMEAVADTTTDEDR